MELHEEHKNICAVNGYYINENLFAGVSVFHQPLNGGILSSIELLPMQGVTQEKLNIYSKA